MTINEAQINTKTWWHNETSGLYFLSTEDDPVAEYRGVLAVGEFVASRFPLCPLGGLDGGIHLSFGRSKYGWTNNETVLFSPSTNAYKIDAQKWRSSGKSMKFEGLDTSIAPHILYHGERFNRVPSVKLEELDPLFAILRELQTTKKRKTGLVASP